MPGVTTAYQTGVHGSRPAVTAGCILYSCTTHGLIYRSDGATWTTFITLTSAGTVATDAIWDAAGDLAVGTGSDTAAKLSIGAVGSVLGRINGAVAWNAGTSFPGSKATDDRYYRSDLDLEFYWDGAQWLTTTLYTAHAPLVVITAASSESQRYRTSAAGLDPWIVAWSASVFVSTTNDGSNNWTLQLGKRNSADTGTSISTASTSAYSPSTWTQLTTTVGAAVAMSSFPGGMLIQASVKTGAPGNCLFLGGFTYRLIGT